MPRAPAYTPRLGGRGCGNPGLIRSRAIGASCSPLRLPPVRAEVPPHRGPKEGTDDHAKSRFFDHRQSSPAIQAASFLTRRLPRESDRGMGMGELLPRGGDARRHRPRPPRRSVPRRRRRARPTDHFFFPMVFPAQKTGKVCRQIVGPSI